MRFIRKLLSGPFPGSPSVGLQNASTREQWVQSQLRSLPAGWRLLDAGAGECQFRRFCEHLNYVSQDFAKYDGIGDGRGLHTNTWDNSQIDLTCDITSIPEADGSFDAILCTEVLEHLPNPQLALKEFARLLRPGGRLLITAPFVSFTHFAPYHFATGFNRYFYLQHLNALGFADVSITANGNFFEFVAQEIRRINECAQMYSKIRLSLLELCGQNILLAALRRLSACDRGSDNLCCFGLHVSAVRCR